MNTANLLKIHHGDNDALLCDSRDMAMHLGIEHKSLLETIRKHQTHIESYFERVTFKTSNVAMPNNATRKDVSHALLTEIQATFIVTLSRNTPRVVEFKATLVTSFYRAREAMQAVQLGSIGKTTAKAKNDNLTDDWVQDAIELDAMALEEACRDLFLSKVQAIEIKDIQSIDKVIALRDSYLTVNQALKDFSKF
jgi:phage regulator Rha-like protein